jgi:hypothetical protein
MTELDDEFFALVSSLDIAGIEVDSVSEMSTSELLATVETIRAELLDARQYIHPTTDQARELHSRLAACKIELNRRTNGS